MCDCMFSAYVSACSVYIWCRIYVHYVCLCVHSERAQHLEELEKQIIVCKDNLDNNPV